VPGDFAATVVWGDGSTTPGTIGGSAGSFTVSGSHVFRYEQNPKPLSSYQGDDDDGYDGVTVQWFETMADYEASITASDVGDVMADVAKFLDVDHLEFVVTENPVVVIDGAVPPGV